MKILLDTSCLISIFLEDVHHAKAVGLIQKIARGEYECIISSSSIIEFCSVIRRSANEAKALETKKQLDYMIWNGIISVVDYTDIDDIALLAIKTSLKCVDAIIVEAAKRHNAALCTFDEEMKKKANGLVDFYQFEP